MKYNVIIPIAYKDLEFVPIVIRYIRRYLVNADKIFSITNLEYHNKLRSLVEDQMFYPLDENSLIEGLSFNNVKQILSENGEERPSQTGWYFQQLLKFAFAHTKYAGDYFLTWDADTLPLNSINFFNNEQPLFTKKIE